MISMGDLNGVSTLSSTDWQNKNAVEQGAATVGAALVDVGVTMWNSVANIATFGNYDDIATRSVLQSMGADGAVSAYDNNRDTIDLLSFVGGVFIPGGAALKLSRGIRAGMKGTSFLSPVRHKEDLLKFDSLIKDAKTGTAQYKELKRNMYLRGQAENLMDNVAAEVAILGTFNAHPYMEDYFEDPVSNFGLSLAVGGIVGGAVGGLISRAEIGNAIGKAETSIANEVLSATRTYATPYSDTASASIMLDLSSKNLDNIAKMPTITPAAKELATNMSASMKASIAQIHEGKISEDILKGLANPEERASIIGLMSDPRFIGAEKMELYKPGKKPILKAPSMIQKVSTAMFKKESIDLATGDAITEFNKNVYFNQEVGAFISKKDADLIASAADLTTKAEIIKQAKKYSIKQVTTDFKDKLQFAKGGEVEADYLARLQFYSTKPTKELVGAEILADDLPAINGWLGAVETRTKELTEKLNAVQAADGELGPDVVKAYEELTELRNAKIKVYESERVQLVNLEEVPSLPTASIDPTDVISPSLFDDLEADITSGAIKPIMNTTFREAKAISDDFYRFAAGAAGLTRGQAEDLFYNIPLRKMEQYAIDYLKLPGNQAKVAQLTSEGAELSPTASLMLLRWIGGAAGDKEVFRNAMASARTLRAGKGSSTPFHDELSQILNSPLIKQQQLRLQHYADGKGNIYLKRGMTSSPKGDTTVSSFTHKEDIARSFAAGEGGVGTYKIHYDDVVGYLYNGEREWLVGATTRDPKAALKAKPKSNANLGKNVLGSQAPKFSEHSVSSLKDYNARTKITAIADELRKGSPRELVGLKYNITQEALELIGSGDLNNIPNKMQLLKQQMGDAFDAQFNKWNSPSQLDAAFAATRRTLKVSAKESNIMGTSGEILERQRQSILGLSQLTSVERQLLNSADNTEAAQHLGGKFAQLDKQFNDINTLFVQDAVASSKSKLAQKLSSRIVDSEWTAILREGIKEMVNGKGGNPLYSSADFVTSRMGNVGKIITELGDTRVHLVNKMYEELMTPASKHMSKLSANPVARTEFAIFDNLRQSTKGVLRYDADLRTYVTAGEGITWDRAAGGFIKMETDPNGQLIKTRVQGIEAFPEQAVKDDSVHNALLALQAAGDEVWEMQATVNKLKGVQTPSDVGFWVPATNISSANRAFILNKDDSSVKLLVGNSEEDLRTLIASVKLEPNQAILSPSDVDKLKLSNHSDLLDDVGRADVEKIKKGIGLAAPDISSDRLADIVNGFKSRLNYQASTFTENALYDVTSKLDYLSSYNQRLAAKQGAPGFLSAVKQLQTKDTAKDVKAILTGNSQIGSQEFMGYVNNAASAGIYFGIKTFQRAFQLAKPAYANSNVDYNKFNDALKASGIEDPFAAFNEAARPFLLERAKNSGYSVTPDRLINGSNALAATMALKFGEVAQALVNALSLPILQISTISRSVKAAGITTAADLANKGSLSVMYAGVRRSTSQLPENTKWHKFFEEEGLLEATISEVDDVIRQSRFGTGSLVGGLEKALDSKFVEVMSKPTTIAEGMVRKTTLMTGVELAYRIYGPKVSDRQVSIFARDFLKQTLGNYSTSQRPMMFQGTFGAAMGLFQTYMLTYAQNMYRHLDLKDYKGLGKTMLAQGGIFGAGSLPGFQPISHAIGENFSDDNMDLTTGLYRGLPDDLADIIVYGLPSNLAPAVHTRGDVTPRIPTGFTSFVAPSMIGQLMQSAVDVGQSILQADRNSGQAFMEALSMQSVSRPIARLSELATGYSVTRQGNQIAGPDDVWSFRGIAARVMSTRPLAESKVREAIHLNSVYSAANSENRTAVLETLRTAIRNDTVDENLMDNLAYEYMRTGSPQGFRQAVNHAFMENANTKLVDLHSKLGQSPLMLMLDDLD